MKIQFNNIEDADAFLVKVRANKDKIELLGETYSVISCVTRCSYFKQYEVEINLIHIPKRTYPEFNALDEDYLKSIRQINKNLLKYTDAALAHFVESGQLTKYLEKYNSDGSNKK